MKQAGDMDGERVTTPTLQVHETGLPTLQQELLAQQKLALTRLTPGIVVVLTAYAILGFAKYWTDIPLAGGAIWAFLLAVLLGGALFRYWRQQTGRRLLVADRHMHRMGFTWALLLGLHFAWAIIFVMPLDDSVGRTTFAIMALSLAGMTLASTYMVPRLTIAFLGPMVAAALFGALVGDPAVSSLQKVLTMTGFVVTASTVVRVNWLTFRTGVAVMVDRERHRLEVMQRRSEMQAAHAIQRRLLPETATLPPGEARFQVAVEHRSAQEMTGDLYDFFMIDRHRLFFMVGDVCGKGVTSSLLMAMTKVMVKSAVLRADRPVGEVMAEVSRELLREDHDHQFVTCFAGILDARTGAVSFCNAGHEPARLFLPGQEKVVRSPHIGGPPLCTFEDVPYETGHLDLAPGASLLIVTDGVTEARDAADREFGAEGLDRAVSRAATRVGVDATPAGELLPVVRQAVDRFLDGRDPSDDLTILALRWNGPGS